MTRLDLESVVWMLLVVPVLVLASRLGESALLLLAAAGVGLYVRDVLMLSRLLSDPEAMGAYKRQLVTVFVVGTLVYGIAGLVAARWIP